MAKDAEFFKLMVTIDGVKGDRKRLPRSVVKLRETEFGVDCDVDFLDKAIQQAGKASEIGLLVRIQNTYLYTDATFEDFKKYVKKSLSNARSEIMTLRGYKRIPLGTTVSKDMMVVTNAVELNNYILDVREGAEIEGGRKLMADNPFEREESEDYCDVIDSHCSELEQKEREIIRLKREKATEDGR